MSSLNPSKSLSSIMAILFAIYSHSSDIIVSELFEYLVFYNGDTSINLALYSRVSLSNFF